MASTPVLFSTPFMVGTMRLGSWGAKFTTNEYEKFINQCLALGLYEFDFADIYGDYTTEEEFGKVIKNNPSLKENITITTKCGIKMVAKNRPEHSIKSYDLSPGHIMRSVERSLKNLGVEQIDLLLLHRPGHLMNPFEIAKEFSRLQESGKVKFFGVSNFSPHQFKFLQSLFPLKTNQIEVSILQFEAFTNDTLSICLKNKIRPSAWSPYGGGAIFQDSEDERVRSIRATANPLTKKYNCSLDQLLLAWLLKHPSNILPVLGSTKISNLKSALKAFSILLDTEDWYALWQASTLNPDYSLGFRNES